MSDSTNRHYVGSIDHLRQATGPETPLARIRSELKERAKLVANAPVVLNRADYDADNEYVEDAISMWEGMIADILAPNPQERSDTVQKALLDATPKFTELDETLRADESSVASISVDDIPWEHSVETARTILRYTGDLIFNSDIPVEDHLQKLRAAVRRIAEKLEQEEAKKGA